jgi:hypothetical protein
MAIMSPGSIPTEGRRRFRGGLVSTVAAVVVLLAGLPAWAATGDLGALTSRIAELNDRITELQAEAAALQASLDAVSGRIQAASDRTGRLREHLARLEITTAKFPDEDRSSAAGALDTSRRALDRAERELTKVMAEAKRDAMFPRLLETQQELTALIIERDRALLEQAGLEWSYSAGPETGHGTFDQWARLFLQTVGLPICSNNLVAVVAWQAAEGTSAAWNPLATTLRMPGSTSFNSVGVQNYRSLEEGLQATAQTLWKGYSIHGYGWILYHLSACADPMTTASAINASNWCRGCAGGEYVVRLVPDVLRNYALYAGR